MRLVEHESRNPVNPARRTIRVDDLDTGVHGGHIHETSCTIIVAVLASRLEGGRVSERDFLSDGTLVQSGTGRLCACVLNKEHFIRRREPVVISQRNDSANDVPHVGFVEEGVPVRLRDQRQRRVVANDGVKLVIKDMERSLPQRVLCRSRRDEQLGATDQHALGRSSEN